MVNSGGSNETHCVFVTTNIDTRLVILLDNEDSVSAFKDKICKEHVQCFPTVGKITVSALKVKLGDKYYHLPDSMILRNAIQGISNNDSFLYVDVIRVEEKGELQTLEACGSNPEELDRKTSDPTVEVAGKKTKKRKLKSLCSKSRKKPSSTDSNHSALVDEISGKEEVEALAKGAIGKELDLVTIEQEKDLAPTLELVDENHKDDFLSGATKAAIELNQTSDGENEGLIDGVNATSEAIHNETEIGTQDSGEEVAEEVISVKDKEDDLVAEMCVESEIGTNSKMKLSALEKTEPIWIRTPSSSTATALNEKTSGEKEEAAGEDGTGTKDNGDKVAEEVISLNGEPDVVISDAQENLGKVVKKSRKQSDGVAEPLRRSTRLRFPNRKYLD